MSQPKILKIRVDASVGRHRRTPVAAYACFIKPYNTGIRGKSFQGQTFSGMLSVMNSTDAEFVAIVLAMDQATKFANVFKINTNNARLVVETDCEGARLRANGANESSTIMKKFIQLSKRWQSVEIVRVSSKQIRSVHLAAQKARKEFGDILTDSRKEKV